LGRLSIEDKKNRARVFFCQILAFLTEDVWTKIQRGRIRNPELLLTQLFDPARIELVRKAAPNYYGEQRNRYGEAFEKMGLKLYSGEGGFYHFRKRCCITRSRTAILVPGR